MENEKKKNDEAWCMWNQVIMESRQNVQKLSVALAVNQVLIRGALVERDKFERPVSNSTGELD